MNERKAQNAKNAVRFAVTSERFLSSRGRHQRGGDRASIRTNTTSRATAAANNASVEPENQPWSAA